MDYSSGSNHRFISSQLNTSADSSGSSRFGWRWVLRLCFALVGIFCCYRLSVDSATNGASRLLSMIAIFDGSVEPTDRAVILTPNDPEAHYTRALTLVNMQRLEDALEEFRMATQLRPHHYYEWLDLGVTLDRMGDQAGAGDALRTSIRLAPSFAQPRWQLGNMLFREGRTEEAFAEMRLAVKSNPGLFRGMVDLASSVAKDDVPTLARLVQPQIARHHLELAKFLAMHRDGPAAASQVAEAGDPTDDLDRMLLRDTISELLAARQFSDARAAWIVNHPTARGASDLILNGDFREPIKQNDSGFGWQITSIPNVAVSIDPSGPTSQAMSVRLEFNGASVPQMELLHQLILVRPKTRYTLSFMARTEDFISGGPPVVFVNDVSGAVSQGLGQSKPLSDHGGWNSFQVDFSTDEKALAVVIGLQRLPCTQSPCPVFGRLWLSRFSVVKS